MTLQEMLEQISRRYPHPYTTSQIVADLNEIQKELFRTVYRPVTSFVYDIIAELPFYPLDIPRSNVIDVLVNGVEIPYKDVKREGTGRFYYFFDKYIGIYPTPKEDIPNGLMVYHYKVPTPLSSGSLYAIPDFDPDFHMLMVLAECRNLAAMAQDAPMVQNFTADYNSLLDEFYKANDETPDYPVIENVMGVMY